MTKHRKNIYTSSVIILAAVFCLFLLPSPAHGQIVDFLVGNTVLALLAGTLSFIRGAMVNLIGLVASSIDSVLKFGIADSPVVQESWDIVRNFANMLFIIALIVMSFGIIFNIRGYDAKTLIARFIIAALLINFSLVIGNVMIGWTQSLSNVFLSSIGDIGARIAVGVSIADLFKQSLVQVYTVDNRLWTETITVFINILLLSIPLFSLLVLLILTLIRIPILWALLIVSPVAWMAYILPSTNNISQRWWKEFIGWNLFLPIYLFFIYFGTFFLANQQRVISGIANQPLDGGLGTTFQQLFFFVLVATFLIGGAKVAHGMSSAAGAGGVAAGIWARGRATARFAGSAPFKYGWRASGAETVYKEAADKFKKEGFAGFEATEKNLGRFYRGERGRDETAAWLGQKTGLAPGLAGKQFEKNVDSYQQRYRTITDEAKLRSLATAGPLEQQVAASSRLKEMGRLSTSEEIALYDRLESGGQHLAARRQAERIDYGSLSKTERENAYNIITDIDIKRKIQNIRQKKGDFVDATSMENAATLFTPGSEDQLEFYRNGKSVIADSFTTAERQAFYNNTALNPEVRRMVSEIMIDKGEIRGPELQNALNIIPGSAATPGTPEHRAFSNEANRLLEKARKHDLITAVQIQTRLGLVANKSGPPGTMFTSAQVGAALSQELGNLSVSKILELPDPVLASPEFQTTVVPTLSIQKIEKLLTDASSNQRTIIEPAIVAKRTSLSNDTLSARAQPLTNALRRLQGLTRQIRGAPTPGDKKALIAQAQESLDRSQRLIAEIEDIKYADQTLKDSARTVFDYITGTYYKAIQ